MERPHSKRNSCYSRSRMCQTQRLRCQPSSGRHDLRPQKHGLKVVDSVGSCLDDMNGIQVALATLLCNQSKAKDVSKRVDFHKTTSTTK